MTDDNLTTQEIARDIKRIAASVTELRVEMREGLKNLDDNYVRKDVLAALLAQVATRIENSESRHEKTEGWIVWAQRAIIGAVVAAIMTALYFHSVQLP
jgi:predicted transcriptional regulator